MRNVILVGSGPSIIGRKLGETIDKFDIVVRFNTFKTAGFEKDVGSKIDDWWTWGAFNRSNEIRSISRIFQPIIGRPHVCERVRRETPKIKAMCPEGVTFSTIDGTLIERVYGLMGLDYPNGRKKPSSGSVALAYYTDHVEPQVYAVGFDGLRHGCKQHYYEGGASGSASVDSGRERKYMQSLVSSGKVEVL